jgi:hypothetical protein
MSGSEELKLKQGFRRLMTFYFIPKLNLQTKPILQG